MNNLSMVVGVGALCLLSCPRQAEAEEGRAPSPIFEVCAGSLSLEAVDGQGVDTGGVDLVPRDQEGMKEDLDFFYWRLLGLSAMTIDLDYFYWRLLGLSAMKTDLDHFYWRLLGQEGMKEGFDFMYWRLLGQEGMREDLDFMYWRADGPCDQPQ